MVAEISIVLLTDWEKYEEKCILPALWKASKKTG
jgi:hypothetical protein